MSKKVGFIGLGNMGKPMAHNILKKGYDLTVFDIRIEPMRELEARGAKIANNLKELSSQVNVVITMLPGPPEIREVILGENGVIRGLNPGSVVIDMSTSSPTLTKEIARKLEEIGCWMLDAPVSRSIPAAEKGTLSIMVGGNKDTLEGCSDVLECMATDVIHIGANGMGHVMKLVNQIKIHTEIISICEAFALGIKAGIDPNIIFNVITKSTGNSFMFQYKAPRILTRNFEPGGSVDLAYKDLLLAVALARDLGVPLFLPNIAAEIYQTARALGLSKKDTISIITIFENYLGCRIGESVNMTEKAK